MKLLSITLACSIIVFISSCQSNNNSQNENVTEKTITGDAIDTTLINMRFDLIEQLMSDSINTYIAESINNNDTLGFKVDINANILKDEGVEKTLISQDTMIANAVKLYADGAKSDALIGFLSNRFAIHTNNKFISQGIYASVFPKIEKIVDQNMNETIKLTLYFPEHDDVYAPMLNLSVNTARKIIEITEVDKSNRQKLLNLLSQK